MHPSGWWQRWWVWKEEPTVGGQRRWSQPGSGSAARLLLLSQQTSSAPTQTQTRWPFSLPTPWKTFIPLYLGLTSTVPFRCLTSPQMCSERVRGRRCRGRR